MQNYTCEQLGRRVWRIVDALGVAMYLVIGQDRACLIDTGYGLAGLRSTVESLTNKPVFVLLTHGHIDHAFGIYEFDEIYMDPRDRETYETHADPAFRERFIRRKTPQYDELVFQTPHAVDFNAVADGQRFDLGGLHIEALHVPGHTKGTMMYLLAEERMMLFGDACGPNTMIMEDCSSPLRDYYASLQKVKRQEARYDRVLRCHGSFESPKEVLDNVTEICAAILGGTDAHQRLPDALQTMFPSKEPGRYSCYSGRQMVMGPHGPAPVDGKEGNINYREDKV